MSLTITGLAEKAPRIVWESTRVIGNTVHLFSNKFDKVVPSLLKNTNQAELSAQWLLKKSQCQKSAITALL